MELVRYWVTFDFQRDASLDIGLRLGCGVTALGLDDALYLIRTHMPEGHEMPPIKAVIENVDVSTLDPKHILPNMKGNPTARGIWFPQGFDWPGR